MKSTATKTKPQAKNAIMRGITHNGQTVWVREIDHVGTVEQASKRIIELAQEHPGVIYRVARIWPGRVTETVTKMVTKTVADTPLDNTPPSTVEASMPVDESAPATVSRPTEVLTAPARDDHDDDADGEDDGYEDLF